MPIPGLALIDICELIVYKSQNWATAKKRKENQSSTHDVTDTGKKILFWKCSAEEYCL